MLKRLRTDPKALIGGTLVFFFSAMALFAPLLAPFDPAAGDATERLRPPDWGEKHILGTDGLGRDVLSRAIYGARVSILIGLTVVLISTVVGVILGLISGYFGGWLDGVIQRIVDVLLAFPYLVFALALMAAFGPGLFNLFLALVYKEWVTPCRVIRAEVLAAKHQDYVQAARACGAGWWHIVLRDLLPNVISSVLVVATLRVAWVVIMEASLSFLGLGVQPPTPSWGSMVADGRDYISRAWWISTFPGAALLLLALGINLLGEGLRDALDPKLARRPSAVEAG